MAEKVRLVKSEKVRLTKLTDGELRRVTCGMGWKPSGSGSTWDLDQSLVVIDESGEYVKQISYMSTERSHEFYYHGDDLVGGSGGNSDDDEKIDISFQELSPKYDRLIVIMNIYEAFCKWQDLSMVKDAYIHLWDVDSKKDLVEYRIENSAKFKDKTGMFVGEFYKKDGEWEFQAIGEPVRVRAISDMVEIIQRKYANVSTKEQSWEEFLATSTPESRPASSQSYQQQYVTNDSSSRRRGFFSRLFGR